MVYTPNVDWLKTHDRLKAATPYLYIGTHLIPIFLVLRRLNIEVGAANNPWQGRFSSSYFHGKPNICVGKFGRPTNKNANEFYEGLWGYNMV